MVVLVEDYHIIIHQEFQELEQQAKAMLEDQHLLIKVLFQEHFLVLVEVVQVQLVEMVHHLEVELEVLVKQIIYWDQMYILQVAEAVEQNI